MVNMITSFPFTISPFALNHIQLSTFPLYLSAYLLNERLSGFSGGNLCSWCSCLATCILMVQKRAGITSRKQVACTFCMPSPTCIRSSRPQFQGEKSGDDLRVESWQQRSKEAATVWSEPFLSCCSLKYAASCALLSRLHALMVAAACRPSWME
jgi:hypothetical protein